MIAEILLQMDMVAEILQPEQRAADTPFEVA